MLSLQVPPHGVGMGRLCCLKQPLQVMTVVELVKKHLNLLSLRLALARHKHMGKTCSLSLYVNIIHEIFSP
jgi:hypothetical protein